MRILIPQTPARNVLAAIRAFGRAGHRVTLAVPTKKDKRQLYKRYKSKFVEQVIYISSPATPDQFMNDLLELVTAEAFDVLLPFTHAGVLPISYHKTTLSDYVNIPFPEYNILRYAHDKLETVKIARQIGVPTPVTFHPGSREELFALEANLPFPVLVKARQGCGVGTTIRFARNFDELVDGYDEISGQTSNPPINDFSLPIIQEYVPGQIYDANFLFANGESRAALTQERVITYPIQGGPGAVNRTTNDPDLRELGARLLTQLKWHGPAQVEFRMDPRDNTYKLLEINPKFWGTMPLSLVAGINFAEMACKLAFTGDVQPSFEYEVGVTYRWLFPTELYALLQKPTPRRVINFLNFWRANTYYDLDIKDLRPDLFRAGSSLLKLILRKKKLLPVREDLNHLAMQRPPAQQLVEIG